MTARILANRIPHPEGLERTRIDWPNVGGILVLHSLAACALIPALFSWTGVCLFILGLYVFGTLGINLCYHRLLTHRSFCCPSWLEHALSVLGLCCLQDTPARWVAIHRLHHLKSDDRPDPHSPLVHFFWAHIGWLLVENRSLSRVELYDKFARDVLRDPFYFRLERRLVWLWAYLIHAIVFWLAGFAAGWAATGSRMSALHRATSVLVWGVALRTVAVWHITWAINSVTHIWGYRNYETDENSRNNWIVGLLSNGEGWHNNHHADQRSAAHGHRWWELDVTYLTIQLLRHLGLASHVALPRPTLFAPGELPLRRAA